MYWKVDEIISRGFHNCHFNVHKKKTMIAIMACDRNCLKGMPHYTQNQAGAFESLVLSNNIN